MIRTRTRKIIRDLTTRKARTALVATAIFVGVLGVVTLTSLQEIILDKLNGDFKQDRMPMFWASVQLPDANTTNNETAYNAAYAETLATIYEQPGVTLVEGRIREQFYWKEPDDNSFIEATMRTSTTPLDQQLIETPELVEGAWPVVGQRQLLIERRMAKRYDLKVGDPMVIVVTKDLANRPDPTAPLPQETWIISGILHHPYIFEGDTSVYMTFEDAQSVTAMDGFTGIGVRFTDVSTAEANARSLAEVIENDTPYDVYDMEALDPAENEFILEMEQWTDTLTALSILAMIVSSFLVVTVISTLVAEQRRQIGVMKSIGATRTTNQQIYTGIAFAYGIIGMIPGVLLGIPAAYGLAQLVSPLMNIIIDDFTISPTGVGVGVALGLMVPVVAAVVPVFLGTRVTILEAMTDLGLSGNYGTGPIARLIKILPLPHSSKQALANLSQRKGRLFLTGMTLTLAVGSFMGVTALFMSLSNTIDDIFATFNFEVGVFPERVEDSERAAAVIEQEVEGVSAVMPGRSSEEINIILGADDEDVEWDYFFWGFDPNQSAFQLNLEEGTGWNDDPNREGIVITHQSVEQYGWQVGDTITLQSWKHPERKKDFEIIGIDAYPEDGLIFMRWQDVAWFVNDAGKQDQAGELYVRFDDRDMTPGEVDKKIGDIRQTLLRHGMMAGFWNQTSNEEEESNLINTVGLIFNIASAVMAAVGAIGLLTALSISVFERQREIGVMRSIGASSRSIAGQFLTEGLFVGLIAWLIGIPLSIGIGSGLMSVLPIEGIPFNYPPVALVLGLVGMLLIAIIASLWPSLSAARKTVSDILRYQ